jgi:hypothetical protein
MSASHKKPFTAPPLNKVCKNLILIATLELNALNTK